MPDLTGSSTPFPPETLRQLYLDHDAYVARFEAAVRHGLDQGFLMPRDAKRLRAEAAASAALACYLRTSDTAEL